MKAALNWRFGTSESVVYRLKEVKEEEEEVKEILGISVQSTGDFTEEMMKKCGALWFQTS